MRVPKINILLTTMSVTHDEIAKATGVSRQMVSATIKGDKKSKRTQDRITDYIRNQITTESLFGIEPESTSGLRSKRKRADLS